MQDSTFKLMFKDEKLRPWINNLIKGMCDIDISDYEISDSEMNDMTSKDFRADVLMKDADSDVVIIESQTYNGDLKNYLYLYRIAGKNIPKGVDYDEINITNVLIQFKTYNVSDANGDILMHFQMMDEKHPKAKRPNIESYEIILSNLKNKDYNKLRDIEKKLMLLVSDSIEEMKSKAIDQEDEKMIERMEELKMDPNEIFFDKETEKKLEMYGAHKQGVDETKIEIAQKMLEEQMDLELIAKLTSLSIEEINILKEKKD